MAADPTPLLRQAAGLLQQGRLGEMRALMTSVLTSGQLTDNPQAWMMLGEACRRLEDATGWEQAADRVIALAPHAARAYVWKGDCRLKAGEARAASSWYKAALDRAGPHPPEELRPELDRAARELAALDARYAGHMARAMADAGFSRAELSARVARSVDLLNGQARLFLQEPTLHYLPGLAQREFWDRDEMPWAGVVEAATPAIRAELDAILSDPDAFAPYLVDDPDRPRRGYHGMIDNPDWSALHLTHDGEWTADARARFPATLAALEQAPLTDMPPRAPTVMFSLLRPGARIAPHHGMINARLICHLPLIAPGKGALRVGGEARGWTEGELLLFDDSVEHEAWNDADSDRVVLIFDVWKPEVTGQERNQLRALFAAVDSFAG